MKRIDIEIHQGAKHNETNYKEMEKQIQNNQNKATNPVTEKN